MTYLYADNQRCIPDLRGLRLIYEECRDFVAVDVLDMAVEERGQATSTALKTIAIPSSIRQVIGPPELGEESVISEGVHARVEGDLRGPHLRMTLEVAALPGFATNYPRRFTISGQVGGLSADEDQIAAYMGIWRLTIAQERVQSLIRLATQELPCDIFRSRCRELERNAQRRG